MDSILRRLLFPSLTYLRRDASALSPLNLVCAVSRTRPPARFTQLRCANHPCVLLGKAPSCDSRMIEGWTGKALGAKAPAREAYVTLSSSETFKSPLSWLSPDFSLLSYDILVIPGGHDKGVKQIIESSSLRSHVREFFPLTDASGKKVCGAICHGVMVLAWTKVSDAEDAESVLYERKTTTLPLHLERLAVYSTAPVLGDYYRTYAGTWTSHEVQKSLKTPQQYIAGPYNFTQSYAPSAAHVVKDEGYISGRWPGDAQAWSEAIWEAALARNSPHVTS